jgi:exodeoxyribonuclease VII large subunit
MSTPDDFPFLLDDDDGSTEEAPSAAFGAPPSTGAASTGAASAGAASAGRGIPRRDVASYETVAALTSRLRRTLERDFAQVLVEGEVSNWRPNPSGHVYFSLKDKEATLSCVLWRQTARRPDVAAAIGRVRDGVVMRASGRVSVYEPRGSYQLVVNELKLGDALGDLWRKLQELKEKLEKEGLFASDRKRPLPPMARAFGVLTSAGGAALRDILNVARRRSPGIRVVVEHAPVQGNDAPPKLLEALARLAARANAGEIDAAIVARGGGSFEDLFCFNDEALVRAIAAFPVPIVSGVGHETDFTLCDMAADLRAPTPSAAAEAVAPNLREWLRRLEQLGQRARRLILSDLNDRRLRLERLANRPAFQDPHYAVNRQRQRLDDFATRLERALVGKAALARRRLDALGPRLVAGERRLAERRGDWRSLAERLRALDPGAVLRRGYAAVSRRTAGGVEKIISSVAEAPSGSRLVVSFADGDVAARSLGSPDAAGNAQLELFE